MLNSILNTIIHNVLGQKFSHMLHILQISHLHQVISVSHLLAKGCKTVRHYIILSIIFEQSGLQVHTSLAG
jgi:hypothetical protein